MALAALAFAHVEELADPHCTFPEPSGIAYHPQFKTLFVAGDEGYVAEMTRDGAVTHFRYLGPGLDLEGITVGPDGCLYLCAEKQPPTIIAVDPETLQVRRSWEVDQSFGGQVIIGVERDKGLEGLCYVHEVGRFFAINQADPALLVELDLPEIGAATLRASVSRIVARLAGIVRKRASDLSYDPVSHHFLVLESDGGVGKGEIHECTLAGDFLRHVKLAGRDQEGVALDEQGSLFLAQDSGGILRLDP
ncbi:MAG: SdiA-regulated domain-containing protein [Thermomicrobiales bacterium]